MRIRPKGHRLRADLVLRDAEGRRSPAAEVRVAAGQRARRFAGLAPAERPCGSLYRPKLRADGRHRTSKRTITQNKHDKPTYNFMIMVINYYENVLS